MNEISADIKELMDKIQLQSKPFEELIQEINKVIVGQKYMINRLLVGLLSGGHILLEGVPGLAKTLAVKSLARAIDADFSRLQFTPDLLPADLIGTLVYNIKTNDFTVKKGPVFANFVLADEINRAPAKVQSALLEAMQERQITIGDESFTLEEPFLVLATQNPIEQEGTYPLPEAQIDRFMLKCVISYPSKEEEMLIMRSQSSGDNFSIHKVMDKKTILESRELVKAVYVDEKIEKYILDAVFATRFPEKFGLSKLKNLMTYGASPRGSISLALAAKAFAFLKGRAFVLPEDVKEISKDVLRHRIGLSFEAEAEGVTTDEIIETIFSSIEAP